MNLCQLLKRHATKIVAITVLLIAAAWWLHSHHGGLSRQVIIDYAEKIPAMWFLAAFLLLPLIGFPVSLFLLAAGVRFGLAGGMAMAGVALLFHHVVAYHVTHGWFRAWMRLRLERAGYAIPPIKRQHRAWFTALFAALRGPPYILKLYLLALTDVPFRIYLGVGAPVYIIFCLIPVGAGSAILQVDATWLYVIVALSGLLLVVGYWMRRRFIRAAEP